MESNHIIVQGVGSDDSGSSKSAPVPGYQGIIIIPGSTRSVRRISAALPANPWIVSKHRIKATSNLSFRFNSIDPITITPDGAKYPPGFTYVIAFWKIDPEGFSVQGGEQLIYVLDTHKEVTDLFEVVVCFSLSLAIGGWDVSQRREDSIL